jgi:hypothetical protein
MIAKREVKRRAIWRVVAFILGLMLGAAQTAQAAPYHGPFTGLFLGQGRSCWGGLFIGTRTLTWNKQFTPCARTSYTILDSDLHWPFQNDDHIVLSALDVRSVICFGKRAGGFVRAQLGANTQTDKFTEQNNRRWVSTAYKNRDNLTVIILTHPSIADWTSPATDPTALVQRVTGLGYSSRRLAHALNAIAQRFHITQHGAGIFAHQRLNQH